MFLQIDDLLTPAEVQHLRQLAQGARFVDGRITNPHSKTKNNLQADYQDPAYAESSRIVHAALSRNEELRSFASPKFIAPPLLAKYVDGMNYGPHTDVAFLNLGQRPLRSDLSCTVFLNDPATYEGGELSVRLGTRDVDFKTPAGGAVIYPSTTIHQVKPVTSGERLVSITFMESQIADQTCRELLYQLNEVLAFEADKLSWENRTRLDYVRHSLHRMWGAAG